MTFQGYYRITTYDSRGQERTRSPWLPNKIADQAGTLLALLMLDMVDGEKNKWEGPFLAINADTGNKIEQKDMPASILQIEELTDSKIKTGLYKHAPQKSTGQTNKTEQKANTLTFCFVLEEKQLEISFNNFAIYLTRANSGNQAYLLDYVDNQKQTFTKLPNQTLVLKIAITFPNGASDDRSKQ